MGVEPLLGGSNPLETLERATGMKAVIGPARADQGRHRDPLQRRALGGPISIVERVSVAIRGKVFGPRESPVVPTLEAESPPRTDKTRFGPAILMPELAHEIRYPFPGADRFERGGPQRRNGPLRHGEIGDTDQSNSTTRPGLARRPFDQLVVVLGVARGQHTGLSLRLVHSAGVRLYDGIAGGRPEQRIGRLKSSPFRTVQLAEPHPRQAHEQHLDPIRQDVLAVRRDRHYYPVPPVPLWPEHIGHQARAVAHRDRHIAIEPDPRHRSRASVPELAELVGRPLRWDREPAQEWDRSLRSYEVPHPHRPFLGVRPLQRHCAWSSFGDIDWTAKAARRGHPRIRTDPTWPSPSDWIGRRLLLSL